jgi:hypothetical protein
MNDLVENLKKHVDRQQRGRVKAMMGTAAGCVVLFSCWAPWRWAVVESEAGELFRWTKDSEYLRMNRPGTLWMWIHDPYGIGLIALAVIGLGLLWKMLRHPKPWPMYLPLLQDVWLASILVVGFVYFACVCGLIFTPLI